MVLLALGSAIACRDRGQDAILVKPYGITSPALYVGFLTIAPVVFV